uniref:Uncharacterized protein n=2 Tax=Arion vulgaris TaxID=1028688 RepID=A0A0B7AVZ2_9EUPU
MIVHIVHSSCYITKVLQEGSLNVGNIFDEIYLKGVNKASCFILCNGRKVDEDIKLEDGKIYHVVPRLPGGKGGFGSMLRAIGAQIEKTTSREACRDLSGRRMRDINNEKKLKEWLAKEADREHEREQRRQERLNKQLAPSQHKFDDAEYHEQRAKMQENLQDAVSKGLKRTHRKEKNHCAEKKTKTATESSSSSKTEWFGVDMDSDESNSSSDNEANPGDQLLQSIDGSSCSKDHMDCHASSSSSSHEPSDVIKEIKADYVDVNLDIALSQQVSDSTNIKQNIEQIECKSADSIDITADMQETQVSDGANSNEPIDLDRYSSSSDLAKLGMERLKNALMTRGLKCGGTLTERADRLFLVRGLSSDQIDPSLFAKSKGKGKKSK